MATLGSMDGSASKFQDPGRSSLDFRQRTNTVRPSASALSKPIARRWKPRARRYRSSALADDALSAWIPHLPGSGTLVALLYSRWKTPQLNDPPSSSSTN